jgi:hypothetical protein
MYAFSDRPDGFWTDESYAVDDLPTDRLLLEDME